MMTETHMIALEGCDFSGSKYGNQERYQAVVAYLVNGTLTGASKSCGVPVTTIYDWKQTEWWDALTEQVRNEKEDEFRAGFSRIVGAANKRVEDALENGETKLIKGKDGYEERLIPVNAKDAMITGATAYDKLRLSENLPTRISATDGTQGIQARLEELADQMLELERREKAKLVSE